MTITLIATAVLTFGVSWLATWGALALAHRHQLMDAPNHRSSHSTPTPHGGGLGLMIAVLPALLIYATLSDGLDLQTGVIVAAAAALAGISWLDDLKELPPAGRFIAQMLAVGLGLYVIPAPDGYLGGLADAWLPRPLELILVGLGWVWFVNLYNFMDGIDGITGVQTATNAAGIVLIAGTGAFVGPAGLIVGAGVLGFLIWNWPPAKIFLGDVGSVPLGYLMGWLLLSLAAQGHLAAAVILPLYYLADATLTLVKRALRGEKVWRAHREHAYQRAVQGGASHAQVSKLILATNAALVAFALAAVDGHPFLALVLAGAVVAALLWRMDTLA